MEYVQLQLNYFDWDSPYVAAGRCYEVCKKHGKQVVVMEPVKGGALVNQPQDLEQKLRKAADCDRCGKCMSVSAGQDVIGMLEEAEKTITHF